MYFIKIINVKQIHGTKVLTINWSGITGGNLNTVSFPNDLEDDGVKGDDNDEKDD